jgi:release factor glutamine methyltransferase
VCAVERTPEALALAQRNGARLALAVEWLQGDWWAPLAGRRFDLVVANPPYIDAADPHMQALKHEPFAALSPGADGLAALRTIVAGAAAHLKPEGWLLLEHGHAQGDAVRGLLLAGGLAEVSTRTDLAGLPRCTAGCLVS